MNKILTLAIPTNGVVEWVLPVLDSIYQQNIDDEYFEIVITDNGNNKVFFDEIQKYKKKHNNIVYKKTTAQLFMNHLSWQQESIKNLLIIDLFYCQAH